MTGPTTTDAGDMSEPTTDGNPTYLDLLSRLNTDSAAINTALLHAHVAGTPDARRTALLDLHARLRHMAATANAAIGAWPSLDGPRS
jgi:hypothetical protein